MIYNFLYTIQNKQFPSVQSTSSMFGPGDECDPDPECDSLSPGPPPPPYSLETIGVTTPSNFFCSASYCSASVSDPDTVSSHSSADLHASSIVARSASVNLSFNPGSDVEFFTEYT